jgi:hypothetical protein
VLPGHRSRSRRGSSIGFWRGPACETRGYRLGGDRGTPAVRMPWSLSCAGRYAKGDESLRTPRARLWAIGGPHVGTGSIRKSVNKRLSDSICRTKKCTKVISSTKERFGSSFPGTAGGVRAITPPVSNDVHPFALILDPPSGRIRRGRDPPDLRQPNTVRDKARQRSSCWPALVRNAAGSANVCAAGAEA